MTVIKAAAVQLSPVLYSRYGTVAKVVAQIEELGGQGVQFATFPEAVVPYYPYFSFLERPFEMGPQQQLLLDQTVEIPSPAVAAIGEAAREELLFDADGTLVQRRRNLTPTYHERMIWGQGDGSNLSAADTAVGRVGQLACWEHYNPLFRYALIADGEQIHSVMWPGSFGGELFGRQTEVSTRNHALESASFVVNATSWLDPDQPAGSFTAIITPQGELMGEPLRTGEGAVIADLDFRIIDQRKAKMDARGHYSRPELLHLVIDRSPTANLQEA